LWYETHIEEMPKFITLQRLRTVLNMEVNTLLPITNPGTSGSRNSTLTLVQREPYPAKYLQDYASTSALDGISTVGGLWTFVNGTFIMFFGASVMYFSFGNVLALRSCS
jgi:hypothetical protein